MPEPLKVFQDSHDQAMIDRFNDETDAIVAARPEIGQYAGDYRQIAEEALGRPLAEHEVVHHRNRDPTDKRPENLQVLPETEHRRLHGHTSTQSAPVASGQPELAPKPVEPEQAPSEDPQAQARWAALQDAYDAARRKDAKGFTQYLFQAGLTVPKVFDAGRGQWVDPSEYKGPGASAAPRGEQAASISDLTGPAERRAQAAEGFKQSPEGQVAQTIADIPAGIAAGSYDLPIAVTNAYQAAQRGDLGDFSVQVARAGLDLPVIPLPASAKGAAVLAAAKTARLRQLSELSIAEGARIADVERKAIRQRQRPYERPDRNLKNVWPNGDPLSMTRDEIMGYAKTPTERAVLERFIGDGKRVDDVHNYMYDVMDDISALDRPIHKGVNYKGEPVFVGWDRVSKVEAEAFVDLFTRITKDKGIAGYDNAELKKWAVPSDPEYWSANAKGADIVRREKATPASIKPAMQETQASAAILDGGWKEVDARQITPEIHASFDDIVRRYGTTKRGQDFMQRMNGAMKENGFKRRGRGFSAEVYINEKIGIAAKHTLPDEGYDIFLDIVRLNPRKEFPKIYRIHDLGGGERLVFMERLDPIAAHRYGLVMEGWVYLRDKTINPKLQATPSQIKALGPDLIEALDAIAARAEGADKWIDLHPGNVMQRKNGELVITDPLFPAKGQKPKAKPTVDEKTILTMAAFVAALNANQPKNDQ